MNEQCSRNTIQQNINTGEQQYSRNTIQQNNNTAEKQYSRTTIQQKHKRAEQQDSRNTIQQKLNTTETQCSRNTTQHKQHTRNTIPQKHNTAIQFNLFHCKPIERVQHSNKQCINIARHVYNTEAQKGPWVGPPVYMYHTIIKKRILAH